MKELHKLWRKRFLNWNSDWQQRELNRWKTYSGFSNIFGNGCREICRTRQSSDKYWPAWNNIQSKVYLRFARKRIYLNSSLTFPLNRIAFTLKNDPFHALGYNIWNGWLSITQLVKVERQVYLMWQKFITLICAWSKLMLVAPKKHVGSFLSNVLLTWCPNSFSLILQYFAKTLLKCS